MNETTEKLADALRTSIQSIEYAIDALQAPERCVMREGLAEARAARATYDAERRAEPEFDEVSFIMAYEGGELDEDEIIDGFQHLIDSGTAWLLQGHYGRRAACLIEAGLCHQAGEVAA